MRETGRRIAIIGAGISGLACAGRLAALGHEVRLFDKARGPGGRMSTRRVSTDLGEVAFDHGAQYFTARGAAFQARVRDWAREGIVAPWPAAGPEAWVGTPGMNAPVRALAEGRSIAWNTAITSLSRGGDDWRLQSPEGPQGSFGGVVLALPAEQAAALLAGQDADLAARAGASRTAPCWTVMVAFDRPLAAPDTPAVSGVLGWAARNTSKPGRGKIEAWVLQASPDWSRDHLEDPADRVCDALLEAASGQFGVALPPPVLVQAHRWRYARASTGSGTCLWSPDTGLGVCGDWLSGPRIECAWDSGEALADRMTSSH